MNKIREPLFRASTKHANWDKKERIIEDMQCKTYSWKKGDRFNRTLVHF